MAPKKLQTAVAGLGRMGKRHAINFLTRTPRAELVAAFSPDPAEIAWARTALEPWGVKLYTSFDEMLQQPGLDALVVSTATNVHAEEAIKGIEKGLHVLCEKPLSTNVSICREVVAAAAKRPNLKVMCGFSRRFDASYRDAWQKMDDGSIGRPVIVRSQTCDKHDPSGFFVDYAAWSGGCFVDMSIHDIDLTLWFFGGDCQIKSVSAYGLRAVQPALAQHKDYDNAVGIVEFYNGRMANYFCSRMMAHGQEDTTEIIGTEGKLAVNMEPQINLVRRAHSGGVTKEVPQHYYDRFEMAFVTESKEFTAACLDDEPVPLKLRDAVRAVEIGCALQEALVTGTQICYDETGNRVVEAKL